MSEEEDHRKVVCFLQPNFTDLLKNTEAGETRFTVTVFDDCDTIHVRVQCLDTPSKPEKRVAFMVFKELPLCSEIQEIAFGLISSLPALDEPQLAILVSEDDHVRACVRPRSSEPLEHALFCTNRENPIYTRAVVAYSSRVF